MHQTPKKRKATKQAFPQSKGEPANLKNLLLYGVLMVLALEFFRRIFVFLKAGDAPEWAIFLTSILWGVLGIWVLFYLANMITESLQERWRGLVVPWIFAGPALLILAYYLLIPTFRTLYLSFFDGSGTFIGLENYLYAFTSGPMLESFKNNLIWLVVGSGLSVVAGLVIATLADRTHPWFEVTIKSLIFLPMAISMIGSAVIWRFVYHFQPGETQIGLLNALLTSVGEVPQPWLILQPWNTLFLVVILIWMQAGYAMVIFSAAIKGVPSELLEAARIDGANEIQSFFQVTIPYIRGTIIAVTTTIIIFTLKIFDIVLGMTGGNFGTQVIANEQYRQMFEAGDFGKGSAIAIVLLLTVLPVVYYNVREFRSSHQKAGF
ncbi:carbohydrate ABC transporter permease [Deinococcus misasensis]|uniref:carbohydrate ABC transporter permease n=1 Tax=Deinococcus misasensis TaxID=392413 RepID=UPI000A84DB5C|nr:sugar ABC transporter permease [Deinococcus misasensis]